MVGGEGGGGVDFDSEFCESYARRSLEISVPWERVEGIEAGLSWFSRVWISEIVFLHESYNPLLQILNIYVFIYMYIICKVMLGQLLDNFHNRSSSLSKHFDIKAFLINERSTYFKKSKNIRIRLSSQSFASIWKIVRYMARAKHTKHMCDLCQFHPHTRGHARARLIESLIAT